MSRRRWLLLLAVASLFLVLILIKFKLLASETRPPGVPENWKRHKEVLGRFEMWLPKEWERLGGIRTVIEGLREVAEGNEAPLLFAAWRYSADGRHESVTIKDYNAAFESYAPLIGEELAKECSMGKPVAFTLDFTGTVRLDDSKVMTVELEENEIAIAYQSDVLAQNHEGDFTRTVACVVSRNHAYLVYLDTLEKDNTNIPTYEKVLRTFRVLK